jgi:hypothetical protein
VTVANRRPRLTGNVKVLSLVSPLHDTAGELLCPLLPIYLTTVLGVRHRWSARSRARPRAPHR